MKILLVTDLYPISSAYKDNTITNAIEDFALGLKDFKCNITVIRPNFLFNTLIRNHKIIKNGTFFSKEIKIYNRNFILPFLNSDVSYLNNEKFDVIISHMPSGHIYASLINEKLKLPHIAILHQSDDMVLTNFKYKFYFRNRLKKAINKANLIGARNKNLKEKYNADFVLPSYIDKKYILKNKSFENKKLKLITLSKLIKRKNIDLVIKSLAKFDFDFEYSIYGNGKEKHKLNNLIKKLNLENKIKIYRNIPHEKIYEKLDENDIFILPSINETFGIAYIEAMARGLIVVGCKNTGIDGIIKNNQNGFLINPNEKEITQLLKKLIDIDKNKISNNSIKTMYELTKENVIQEYIEIIGKTIKIMFRNCK